MIPIYEADRLEDLPLFDRPPQAEEDVDAADVRTWGDEALREYTRRFDGADLERFEVTAEELRAAWDCVDGNFRETLRQAADNIRHFHEAQVHRDFCLTDRPGVVLGRRYTPVERVGICVPGSPVAFPSTILMNVIPARIAGVKEIADAAEPKRRHLCRSSGSGKNRRGGPGVQDRRRPGGGGPGLRHGDSPPGGQDRGSRRRLCGCRQAEGVRTGGHRHDRRPQ